MYKVHHVHNNTDIYRPDLNLDKDLFVIETGHSTPPPGYKSNKNIRTAFVIHYVLSGQGNCNGQPFFGPCILFGIPNEVIYFETDTSPDVPSMEQYWIIIGGAYAPKLFESSGFSLTTGVLPCPYTKEASVILSRLQNFSYYLKKNDNLFMISGLYQLMSLQYYTALESTSQLSEKVLQVCNYIHENYPYMIGEEDIAQVWGKSVKHVHRLFKKEMGITPIQYLIDYRIKCAQKLLIEDTIPIHLISGSCGFNTHNYFCSVFRKYNNGMSPSEFRKMYQKI